MLGALRLTPNVSPTLAATHGPEGLRGVWSTQVLPNIHQVDLFPTA